MARITEGQKAQRVLTFLMGLRLIKAISALVRFGFTKKDHEEGWRLLENLSKIGDGITVLDETNPDLVTKIDQFENLWFPIVDASLKRRFPEIREKFFHELKQTEGSAVILSVKTFVRRFDALGSPDEKGNQPSKDHIKAKELLIARGLKTEVMDEIRSQLKQATQAETPETVEPTEDIAAARAEAEEAMWAWYLEWSAIARQGITDRRVLRSLGFLKSSKSRTKSADSIEDPDDSIEEASDSEDTIEDENDPE